MKKIIIAILIFVLIVVAIIFIMPKNYINREIDYGFIRYICGYNNLIDAFTRSLLLRTDTIDYKVVDPFNNLITNDELIYFKSNNGINRNKSMLYKK